jgi:small subunit ribosomal protein S13
MRIAGINIPDEKRLEVALTYIYGIGRSAAHKILIEAKIPNKKTKELTNQEIAAIKEIIDKKHKIEGDLRREVAANIKRLK